MKVSAKTEIDTQQYPEGDAYIPYSSAEIVLSTAEANRVIHTIRQLVKQAKVKLPNDDSGLREFLVCKEPSEILLDEETVLGTLLRQLNVLGFGKPPHENSPV